jgi:hypothetical protein
MVRQKTHDPEALGSNPTLIRPFFMHQSFESNHGNKIMHCCMCRTSSIIKALKYNYLIKKSNHLKMVLFIVRQK